MRNQRHCYASSWIGLPAGILLAAGAAGCTAHRSSTPPVSPKTAFEAYVQGVYAYRGGDEDKAADTLGKAIRQNPQLIMPRVLLGRLEKDRGDYAAAAEQYEVLTRLDPYFVEHYYNLGVSYQMLQRLRDAEKAYQRAVTLSPRNFGANMNLGLVYLALDEADKAVHYTEIAAQLNPASAEAFANLAVALDSRGDHARAEGAYRKSLELAPYQAGTLTNYANNLLQQQKAKQALGVLEEAQKLDDTPYIRRRKGDAMAMLARLDEAVVEYRAALTKNGNYYAAMNECANVLIQQYQAGMELDDTKRDEALALWEKSLAINPNQPRVKSALQDWEKRMFSK